MTFPPLDAAKGAAPADLAKLAPDERAKKVEAEFGSVPPVRDVLDFIQAESKRSLCTPKHGVMADGD